MFAQGFIESESHERIEDSELPDDLLIEIFLLLPPKVAVSTMILSKSWRSFWTMQPQLLMSYKSMYFEWKSLLRVETVVCRNTMNSFSRLTACGICPPSNIDWLEPFMCFLQNSPKLKVVLIIDETKEDFPLSFNPPSSVPACLSTHLEFFEWQGYGGRNGVKEIVRYIFANSMCLTTAAISIKPPNLGHRKGRNKKRKLRKELESMSRDSPSPHLSFSTQSKLTEGLSSALSRGFFLRALIGRSVTEYEDHVHIRLPNYVYSFSQKALHLFFIGFDIDYY